MVEIILEDKHLSQEFFDKLIEEDYKQVFKWGFQKHNPFEWLAYTTEELGELSKAISEYVYRTGTKEEVIKEAVQTATLALKIAKMFSELDELKQGLKTTGGG